MRGRPGRRSSKTARDISLLAASVLAVVVLTLALASRLPSRADAMHADWVRGVQGVVEGIGPAPTKEQAEQAMQALLLLRVTGKDKEAHLALVLALVALQQGKPDAERQFAAAVHAVGK